MKWDSANEYHCFSDPLAGWMTRQRALLTPALTPPGLGEKIRARAGRVGQQRKSAEDASNFAIRHETSRYGVSLARLPSATAERSDSDGRANERGRNAYILRFREGVSSPTFAHTQP